MCVSRARRLSRFVGWGATCGSRSVGLEINARRGACGLVGTGLRRFGVCVGGSFEFYPLRVLCERTWSYASLHLRGVGEAHCDGPVVVGANDGGLFAHPCCCAIRT